MRSYRQDSDKNRAGRRPGGRRGSHLWRAAAIVPLLAVTLAACSDLLDVKVPGFVTSDALKDPGLAETMVLSAVGDFECGFTDYMRYPGQWFEEFLNTSASRPDALSSLRSQLVDVYNDPCSSGTGPVWTVMQLPREQAARAVDLIENTYPAGSVQNQDFLIAKARLYEGYAIQLLGEQFCGVTFDGGPLMSREETYAQAETRFTEAITLASGYSGSRAAEAAEVLNAAYVGRARSRLYQGNNPTGVVSDASSVDEGFQLLATYDGSPTRRLNQIPNDMNFGDGIMVQYHYANLTIDTDGTLTVGLGIPDPRVPVVEPGELDARGVFPKRNQMKYPDRGSDMPFSTWREAQLMIAEVQQGSQAVAIIDNLRTNTSGLYETLDESAWPLPTYTGPTTAADIEALVTEERRRELWMQGVEAGDKLRFAGDGTSTGVPFPAPGNRILGYPAWEEQTEYGETVSPGRCWPVPFLERTSNSNL